jgi:hypothetical protein
LPDGPVPACKWCIGGTIPRPGGGHGCPLVIRGKAGAIPYETPQIIDYGSLVELTAANQDGDFTDANFPVHTPKKDLTFS